MVSCPVCDGMLTVPPVVATSNQYWIVRPQAAAGSEEGMPHATLMNHDRTAVNLANFNAEPSAPQVQKVYNWGRQPDAPFLLVVVQCPMAPLPMGLACFGCR